MASQPQHPRPDQEFPARHPRRPSGAHRVPAHIHRVRAGGTSRGVTTPVPRVYLLVPLTGPDPSGSARPTRLRRGCSHPPRRSPDQAASSSTPPLRRQRWRRSLTSARTNSASWRTGICTRANSAVRQPGLNCPSTSMFPVASTGPGRHVVRLSSRDLVRALVWRAATTRHCPCRAPHLLVTLSETGRRHMDTARATRACRPRPGTFGLWRCRLSLLRGPRGGSIRF